MRVGARVAISALVATGAALFGFPDASARGFDIDEVSRWIVDNSDMYLYASYDVNGSADYIGDEKSRWGWELVVPLGKLYGREFEFFYLHGSVPWKNYDDETVTDLFGVRTPIW